MMDFDAAWHLLQQNCDEYKAKGYRRLSSDEWQIELPLLEETEGTDQFLLPKLVEVIEAEQLSFGW
ncbi:hypothetical protein ACKC9G_02490 [Pokkaliibacter sp. CJK22405]|uniref:hypothetical protein n=1 Tax=Pokkaliibacter sp. CJK22405 TaxID=3384615 RepID=UPI0039855D6C